MNMPRTFTHTWTQTRLESVQDQFRYLLIYGEVADREIDKIVKGVTEKIVSAVGIYGCDRSRLRVIEVELRVDWSQHAQLTLEVPVIEGGLPGWLDRQAPEVRVAGKRFAEVVRKHKLKRGYWVGYAQEVYNSKSLKNQWDKYLGLSGRPPNWKTGTFDERSDSFLDLPEMSVFIRRRGE